ncbi:hypothetical protein PVAND_002765 [Polypedilum vanderplanki]|uniref:Checkpoint protein RAD24-like helical bundle domain-containing protein n=1 Tax=Polypedilum vanderplanki TaxID=319348 RepID=A0A9J6BRZ9_POLVA|nr:hypothetical protein PVAND_002765 [Polypedilum vanderplanki]
MSEDWFKPAFIENDIKQCLSAKTEKEIKSKARKKNSETNEESLIRKSKSLEQTSNAVDKKRRSGNDIENEDQNKNKQKVPKKRKKEIVAQSQPTIEISEVKWLDIFTPKTINELLVHPKKIEEIKHWFQLNRKHPDDHHILLLSGPAGCGKQTCTKMIASEEGFNICEFESRLDISDDLVKNDYNVPYENQKEKFENFLLTSTRFQSLFTTKSRLLIVKDFPNVFLIKEGNEEFWSSLRKFKKYSNAPVVFIITESKTKTLDLEYFLFPENIRKELGISKISMNPITTTMLKKAMKQICTTLSNNEHFKIPTQETIDNIALQSLGDIQAAIYNLQLACQQGPQSLKSKKSDKKQNVPVKKAKKEIGRDEQIDIFHGLGKVMYPKLEMDSMTERMKLTNNPENVAELFYDRFKTFTELLYSNFLKNFTEIKGAAAVSDTLSMSNIFQTEYRQAENLHKISLCMAIRSAMVHNSEGAPSGFRPVKGFASKKFKNMGMNNLEEYKKQRIGLNGGHRVTKKDFFADYKMFSSIIKPEEEESDENEKIKSKL